MAGALTLQPTFPVPRLLGAVTVFCRAEVPADAAPRNLEPHKCEGWEWVSACNAPQVQQATHA